MDEGRREYLFSILEDLDNTVSNLRHDLDRYSTAREEALAALREAEQQRRAIFSELTKV